MDVKALGIKVLLVSLIVLVGAWIFDLESSDAGPTFGPGFVYLLGLGLLAVGTVLVVRGGRDRASGSDD